MDKPIEITTEDQHINSNYVFITMNVDKKIWPDVNKMLDSFNKKKPAKIGK